MLFVGVPANSVDKLTVLSELLESVIVVSAPPEPVAIAQVLFKVKALVNVPT